jgi:DNA-binding FadR family transcriptional regulator
MGESMQRRVNSLALVRSYLESQSFRYQDRIPPERELARQLGLTRTQLRSSMKQLEAEGMVWRHVGKGTFFGSRPLDNSIIPTVQTGPRELMEARIAIESHLARLAALNATADDLARIQDCLEKSEAPDAASTFQHHNFNLHLAVAEAAHNSLLLAVYVAMNSSRYRVVWGRLMESFVTPAHQAQFSRQHRAFVEAIRHRDAKTAEALMRSHLEEVRQQMFGGA